MKLKERHTSDRAWFNLNTGAQCVKFAIEDDLSLETGELERMQANISTLTEILGRLIERTPQNEWLTICGLTRYEVIE